MLPRLEPTPLIALTLRRPGEVCWPLTSGGGRRTTSAMPAARFALESYAAAPDGPGRLVPNPARKRRPREIAYKPPWPIGARITYTSSPPCFAARSTTSSLTPPARTRPAGQSSTDQPLMRAESGRRNGQDRSPERRLGERSPLPSTSLLSAIAVYRCSRSIAIQARCGRDRSRGCRRTGHIRRRCPGCPDPNF